MPFNWPEDDAEMRAILVEFIHAYGADDYEVVHWINEAGEHRLLVPDDSGQKAKVALYLLDEAIAMRKADAATSPSS